MQRKMGKISVPVDVTWAVAGATPPDAREQLTRVPLTA